MSKAEKIDLTQAKQDKLFYFVANVVIYRNSDSRCLVLKRSSREKVHPSKYAVPGVKLEWKDLDLANPTRMNGDVIDFENQIEKLLKREVLEEAGIKIGGNFHYLNNVVFIRPDGIPVVLIKFAAEYISGEVVLEAGSFDEYKWVTAEEVKDLDCIEGIQDEIEQTIELFNA